MRTWCSGRSVLESRYGGGGSGRDETEEEKNDKKMYTRAFILCVRVCARVWQYSV